MATSRRNRATAVLGVSVGHGAECAWPANGPPQSLASSPPPLARPLHALGAGGNAIRWESAPALPDIGTVARLPHRRESARRNGPVGSVSIRQIGHFQPNARRRRGGGGVSGGPCRLGVPWRRHRPGWTRMSVGRHARISSATRPRNRLQEQTTAAVAAEVLPWILPARRIPHSDSCGHRRNQTSAALPSRPERGFRRGVCRVAAVATSGRWLII